MKLKQLEERLNKSLENFKDEAKAHVLNNQSQKLNELDYEELSKQFYYVMYDFKRDILKYLETQEK